MKKFFKDRDNLIIIFVSLVCFIAGCLAIGPLKAFIIVAIFDCIFFLPGIISSLKGKKEIKKSSNISESNIKPKKQKKSKKEKILKIILCICFTFFIFVVLGCVGFAFYIVKEAPTFNPDELYTQNPSTIYDINGDEKAKLGIEKRENITYNQLPEVLIDAIIATEDSNFFQHNGVDLSRFLVASVKQVLTGGGGGASTLTMQVVKNTFTSTTSSGFEGIKRKFTDIYMSVFQVEKKYTKKEILEFYVNSYYLGGGSYGVEQASQTYFGKEAKDINLSEAALIAGLFQAPNAYDPLQHPDKAEQRRNQVLSLMKRHGYITKEEYETAKAIPVENMLVTKKTEDNNDWQGFIDMVVRDVIKNTGKDPYTTSMQIYTTMDPDKQSWINDIMTGKTYTWQNDVVDAGIAVVDVNTGAIVAIGAGRHRDGERQWVNATQLTNQIGSTSKPIYDYAPGIEYENWSTYNLFTDEPYSYTDGTVMNNWDRKYNGLLTLRTALAQSRNIPALKAFQSNKNSNILKFAQSLGLNPEVSDNIVHEAHAIGGYSGEVPVTMAAAYAAFGNGGYYIKPYSYTKIIFNETEEVVETKSEKNRVMSEETAYMMASLLQSSAQHGLGNQSNINGAIYGAKTGTSNYDAATIKAWGYGDNAVNDLWVDGVSPDYAISVWYGYKDRSKEYTNTSYTIGHRTLFQAVAKGIFKRESTWTKPEGVIEVKVEMGSWPAALPSEFTPEDQIVTELFKTGTEPTEVSTKYAKLKDVTNLTGTATGNKLTLKWTGIDTPDPISPDYLSKYFASLYSDEGYRNDAYNTTLNANKATFGSIIYKVYSKNDKGELKFIKETSDTSVEIDVTSDSPSIYVVKSSYTVFTRNASDGAQVSVSLKDVEAKITTSLTVKETVEINQGETYKISSSDVKVMADSKDVTKDSKITYTINNKNETSIDTTKAGTYTIKYTIIYKDKTYTLSRTVKVVEKIDNTEKD